MATFTTPIPRGNITGWHVEGFDASYDQDFCRLRIKIEADAGPTEEYTVQVEKNDVTQVWPAAQRRDPNIKTISTHDDAGAAWNSLKAAFLAGNVKPADLASWLTNNSFDPEQFLVAQ